MARTSGAATSAAIRRAENFSDMGAPESDM
jgi:hypothetical protein